MSDTVPTYRVSPRFLRNLREQAIFGAIGVASCWALFWIASQVLVPTPGATGGSFGPPV